MPNSGKRKGESAEEIVDGFNELRLEQRNLITKMNELEAEVDEHELVITTLKKTDSDRRCFRMIGGVLVERQVKDILPSLESHKENIKQLIVSLNTAAEGKGKEMQDYVAKHDLKRNLSMNEGTSKEDDKRVSKADGPISQSVLVENVEEMD